MVRRVSSVLRTGTQAFGRWNLMTFKVKTALLLLFLLVPSHVLGGSFRVSPVRVSLDQDRRIKTLSVINDSDEDLTIQVDGWEWGQDEEGKDTSSRTKDLVFFPRIFTVPGKGEKQVKIGYDQKAPTRERTFRLHVQEVPDETIGRERSALRMLVRMSVPVFVQPADGAKRAGSVEGALVKPDGITVLVQNTGNVHFLTRTVHLEGRGRSGDAVFRLEKQGWYVLTGRSARYEFEMPPGVCRLLKSLHVTVQADTLSLEETFNVDAAACVD
jgi:fimbrial chaperone protein